MRIGATLAGIVGGTKLQTARDLGIEVSPEGSITDEVIELHVAVLHRTQVSPPMVELGQSLHIHGVRAMSPLPPIATESLHRGNRGR
jgi:hypothetical protein